MTRILCTFEKIDRSYVSRAVAIIAFNRQQGDIDDKLGAAYNAVLAASKVDLSGAEVKVPTVV